MDFVAFETFTENDALPSPQPSLSLPLKSNIENLSAKFSNFKDLTSLLKQNSIQEPSETAADSKIAEKYASLSLQQLGSVPDEKSQEAADEPADTSRNDMLSKRLGRALNPYLNSSTTKTLFEGLESRFSDFDVLVDAGVDGSMARKNLRGDIESDLIKCYSGVLADYSKQMKSLEHLGGYFTKLDSLLSDTEAMLAKDLDSTVELRGDIGKITDEMKTLKLKKALLTSFRQKFTLNEYEEFLLNSNEINTDFFDAYGRAEEINKSCEILLALDNPELGQKILKKNSELLRRANDRVLAFCSRTLSNMYSFSNRERLATLRLCLTHLKHRPDQLREISEAFVESRSVALRDEFDSQMSENSSGSSLPKSSRPIFLSSHDPVRFVADILAYVHSVSVNEAEVVSSLLEGTEELQETMADIVARILASLAKPLKSQIEQVISTEEKISVLYQLFSNLDLYSIMLEKVKSASKISQTIGEAMKLAYKRILIVLTNRLTTVKQSNSARIDLSVDLQPPEWIIDFYSDLLPIMDSMTSDTVFNLPKKEHDEFLALIIDNPVSIFEEHLQSVSNSFSKRDVTIFKLNFLDLVVSKIMPINLLGDKMLELNHVINDLSAELKQSQFKTLLDDCSLTDYHNIMNMICPMEDDLFEPSIYQPITENKLFTKEQLAATNETIQSVLPTVLLDIQSALMKLNSPVLVNEIIIDSSTQFLSFYKLFAAVIEEYLGEPLFSWTGFEIATLLGLESHEQEE